MNFHNISYVTQITITYIKLKRIGHFCLSKKFSISFIVLGIKIVLKNYLLTITDQCQRDWITSISGRLWRLWPKGRSRSIFMLMVQHQHSWRSLHYVLIFKRNIKRAMINRNGNSIRPIGLYIIFLKKILLDDF